MIYDLRWMIAGCLMATCAWGGDIAPGVTWSDDEASPNSLVNSNRLTAFLGDATLKTNAIVDRTAETGTATNDLVLLYDASTNALRKVTLLHLVPNVPYLTGGQLVTGTVSSVQLGTNAVQQWHLLTNWADAVAPNTNLTVNMTGDPGTNIFFLTFRSTESGSNNVPTNSVMAITPLGAVVGSGLFDATVRTVVTNIVNTNTFVSGEFAINTGRIATNHNLGALPSKVRWVMVCKTNDVGYVAGEEVEVRAFSDANASAWSASGASATNVFTCVSSSGSLFVVNGSTGAANASPTAARWRLKVYAEP